MHSATPQLEPALQSGLSTIIMAGRNLRSLPWHCSVFWAHTHPEIMARQTIKTDIGCPLKANMSSMLQLIVAVAAPGDFVGFCFVAPCQHLKRETYGLKKPSPAQPSLSRSLSFSLSDNLSDRPQFSSDTFTQLYCIQKDNCVFMYRDEPLTALWKTSTERKVPN